MTITDAMWNARSAGLETRLLATVHTAANNDSPGADGAATYLVGQPAYRPYVSTQMPCNADGLQAAEHSLQIARSGELRADLLASPVTETLRRVTRQHANSLWDPESGHMARAMTELGRIAPRKGNEAVKLWKEYLRRQPNSTDKVMTMRDYLGAVYFWTFQRGTGLDMLELFGSMLCFTLAADFVDAADGSGVNSAYPYLMAASEGYAYLAGSAPNRMAQEVALGAALTYLKDEFQYDSARSRLLVDSEDPRATPEDCVVSRWWEGFFTPLLRLAFASAPYRHLTDVDGTYKPAQTCPSIARTLASVLRYDDVIDAVPDCVNHETGNEFLTALASGGPASTVGFGQALAEATDATLSCACGQRGHAEAAEHAMGFCVFYPLHPRYNVRRQLVAFGNSGGAIARAIAPPSPGNRLRTSAYSLEPGIALHSPAWETRWRRAQRTVDEIAHRVTRRSIADAPQAAAFTTAAATVLAHCDRADDNDSFHRLADEWQDLFDIALTVHGMGGLPGAAPLRELVGDIWRQTILGATKGHDARLFMDTDIAVRNTFYLSGDEGHRLRRAFFGVVSSAIELSGFNPYQRLTDLVSTICRQP
ncbi:hypothetical protein AB0D27_43955 [Streptomyces sp. NPDC048415]|uniref:hypothetical protein n=1 Tax=Streptomyces sp. NPDC048415 TaxID=3154822 RepID=UPI00343706FD